ncbi:MAG: archease [Candidatus Omnitrophica bacterium]|nr:archease [Candidatus Omnitrophota bacterium]MCM8826426.1 archease [Candidatus Omnitrophota bacterium]
MIKNNYELLEHTADIGIRVKGKDLKEIFINSAWAMFDIIAKRKSEINERESTFPHIVKERSDDLEQLFVNWLNELLYLSATKELIFYDFEIERLDEKNLEAKVWGEDIRNYNVNTEIKAATYHQLKIENKGLYWEAEVIFDV